MCEDDVLEVSVEESGPAGKGSSSFLNESSCTAGPEAEGWLKRMVEKNKDVDMRMGEKGSSKASVNDRGPTQSASGLTMNARPDGNTSAPGTARISSCFKKNRRECGE